MKLPFTLQLQKARLILECLSATARGFSWVIQLPAAKALGYDEETIVLRHVLCDEPVWIDWPYGVEARVVSTASKAGRRWRDRFARATPQCLGRPFRHARICAGS